MEGTSGEQAVLPKCRRPAKTTRAADRDRTGIISLEGTPTRMSPNPDALACQVRTMCELARTRVIRGARGIFAGQRRVSRARHSTDLLTVRRQGSISALRHLLQFRRFQQAQYFLTYRLTAVVRCNSILRGETREGLCGTDLSRHAGSERGTKR